MSHTQKKGAEGGTPTDRRASKQETEFRTEILRMFAEIKQSEKNLETKLEQVDNKIGKMDKKIEETVSELKGQIKEVSKRVDEGLKKTKQEMKEMKREEERLRNEIVELNKIQEEIKDSIAMNDLKQRETNLRLRQIPEVQNENIKERLVKEIAQWMEVEEEDVARTIINAYRMKIKTNKARKYPGDCLVTFKDREMRNLVLQRNREKRLYIDGHYIILFKDIPIRLLKRRESYKPLVQLLKKNRIDFRWEFPEGVSFFYKGVKRRLTSPEEIGKFTRRYKELQVGEEEEKGAEGRSRLREDLELGEEEEQSRGELEEEEEEEEGEETERLQSNT